MAIIVSSVFSTDDVWRTGQQKVQMEARRQMAINYPHLIYIREDADHVEASQWLFQQGMRVKIQPSLIPAPNEVIHTTREHYRFVDAKMASHFKLVWG
jgi:hypothetical protein